MNEPIFVWDTTGLLYAQACDRLDALIDAVGRERRHLVPSGVMNELQRLGHTPSHESLEICDPEEIQEFSVLAEWMARFGSSVPDGRDSGEAWAAAVAELRDAVAIIDDAKARQIIRKTAPDLKVAGVLWAISRGVKEGRAQTPQAYSGLCDQMLQAHTQHENLQPLRWPFQAGGYAAWYEKEEQKGHLD